MWRRPLSTTATRWSTFSRQMFLGRTFVRRLATNAPPKPQGRLSMKELAKKYGWTATGVYFAFTAVDLPLSFLFVHSLGKEKLEDWEIKIRSWVGADQERDNTYVHRAASGGKGLFLTELGIAYIIHKVLIVVRIPLTVAWTPKIAAKLEQWGFRVNRAIPKIDKDALAKTVANTKSELASKSPAAAKALDKLVKDPKIQKETEKIVDSANKATETAAKKNFGRLPTKGNKWFAGFF